MENVGAWDSSSIQRLHEGRILIALLKRKRVSEWIFSNVLRLAAVSSVFVTLGIMYVLFSESFHFFRQVSLIDFLTDTQWTPLFADAHYGILPLLSGTLVTTVVALLIAAPVGTVIAIYLSEYCAPKAKEWLKPALELLAAVPTVVYGYFALLVVSPMLQKLIPTLPAFNMLSAGLVMGIMIIPYVASLSEDAFKSVPLNLREGSYALGATRLQTALKVVFPAAFSGISSSYVLALSRAVGETMIVSLAAGMQPKFTLNPLEPASTITAFIVQVSLGDLPHGSLAYQTIFAAGTTLFLFTFILNIASFQLRKKFREVY
jgi:phosphate transport system permease protein